MGNQQCCQILMSAPLRITSRPLNIPFHAYEPENWNLGGGNFLLMQDRKGVSTWGIKEDVESGLSLSWGVHVIALGTVHLIALKNLNTLHVIKVSGIIGIRPVSSPLIISLQAHYQTSWIWRRFIILET